ncbi:DUF6457 domain-containing protein [Actinoplanes sp. NPDC049596]|uniref:DUF6457 domain-containing protein n=1 Tax=unclassified Actinoplanes TaxID=2626549 RepID=UPI00342AFDE1
MIDLDAWVRALGAELGVDPAEVPTGAVLNVAKDVAHNVVRPGAPVSAYLMGLAVGRGADPAEVAEKVRGLALGWPGGGDEA